MKRFVAFLLFFSLSSIVEIQAFASSNDSEFRKLKTAAIEHGKFRTCFLNKLTSQYCSFEGFDENLALSKSGRDYSALIAERMEFLSTKGKKTASLIYHENEKSGLNIFLFDSEGLKSVYSHSGIELDDTISKMRSGLRVFGRAVEPLKGLTVRSAEWEDNEKIDLIEASHRLLPKKIGVAIEQNNYNRILILPWSSASYVPFSALSLPSGKYLVDQSSIVIVADLDALTLPLNQTAVAGSRRDQHKGMSFDTNTIQFDRALIIGDPKYASVNGYELNPLDGALREAKVIAEIYGSDRLLTGPEADYSTVVSNVERIAFDGNLVHFATHGMADSVNPMDGSMLALAEDHLFGRTIREFRFQFKHPLVVMSACQTGLGKVFPGGSFGLARAWYAGGAGQVVGSLWNVDDEGTFRLMQAFSHQLANERVVPEEALRKAMINVREKHSNDPAIWASFYVFGNPAK